jgi:FkbM family methyltransferase
MSAKTLLYLGANEGLGPRGLLNRYQFQRSILVEAHPVTFKKLQDRFKNDESVVCINACIVPERTANPVSFYYTGNSVSSSVLEPPTEIHYGGVREVSYLPGRTVGDILEQLNIDFIDFYVSDLQGIDYSVLSSSSGLIESGRIGELFLETHVGRDALYLGAVNSFQNFWSLLETNYKVDYISYDGKIVRDLHTSLGAALGMIYRECDVHWSLRNSGTVNYVWS